MRSIKTSFRSQTLAVPAFFEIAEKKAKEARDHLVQKHVCSLTGGIGGMAARLHFKKRYTAIPSPSKVVDSSSARLLHQKEGTRPLYLRMRWHSFWLMYPYSRTAFGGTDHCT